MSLQETINQENYQRLRHYYEQFVDFCQTVGEKYCSIFVNTTGVYLTIRFITTIVIRFILDIVHKLLRWNTSVFRGCQTLDSMTL